MKVTNLEVNEQDIKSFCHKWGVGEFSLFGSALRPDFNASSDVDVLIALLPGVTMTLESYLDMRDELCAMFGGREIDLVEKHLVTNPFRRQSILKEREILYAK